MGGKCCGPSARPTDEVTDAPMDASSIRMKQVLKAHFKPNYIRENEKKVHKALKRGQRLPEKTDQAECQCCKDAPPKVTLKPCTCCGAAFCLECIEDAIIPQYNIRSVVKVCCACVDMIGSYDIQQRELLVTPGPKTHTPRSSRKEKGRHGATPRSGTPRSNRRTKEREMLLSLKAGDKEPQDQWYLISSHWLRKWRSWSRHDSAEDPPGPISNDDLMHGESPGWELNRELRPEKHYRAINHRAWQALVDIYDGGPAIVADRIDIKEARLLSDDQTEFTYTQEDTSDYDSIVPDYTLTKSSGHDKPHRKSSKSRKNR